MSPILDANGRPYPSAKARSSAVVRRSSIDTFSSHPGAGLTADALVGYFRLAERGEPCRQFDCFEDLVEVDGHGRGLMNARIELTSGCEWTLQAGRQDKPSAIAAAALEERLRGVFAMREFVEHHLTATFYGMAASNVVWDFVDGIIAPIEACNVAHRRFRSPSTARADEIWLIGDDLSSLVELLPGQWAISRYRHRNPWAAGLYRTMAWWLMFKRWSIRDWQVFAEMFGLPLAIGFYEEGAGPASRAALEEAVRAIGDDGYAVLSSLTDLVIKETARSGDSSTVYPKIADRADAEMSKLITGGTANTDLGKKGSYAAGDIHADRAYALTRADSRRLSEMFTRDIATWFCRYNGFDNAAPPILKIQLTRDNFERAQVAATIGQALKLDEDQLYEEFGFRRPSEGKGVLFPSKATSPSSSSAPTKGDPNA